MSDQQQLEEKLKAYKIELVAMKRKHRNFLMHSKAFSKRFEQDNQRLSEENERLRRELNDARSELFHRHEYMEYFDIPYDRAWVPPASSKEDCLHDFPIHDCVPGEPLELTRDLVTCRACGHVMSKTRQSLYAIDTHFDNKFHPKES